MAKGRTILAAAACAAIANSAPQRPADLAGVYFTSQMEMAGALELVGDGRFRYQLDYGAVSESAEGDWTFDGNAVRLTSNPMPEPPSFALLADEPAPAGELSVAIEDTGFSWTPLGVLVTFEGVDRPVRLDARDDGRVILPEARRATSVKLLMPVYETGGDPVELSADRGHRLLFRLETNDIGKAPFHGELLTVDGSSFIMRRYDTTIVFRRASR